jgi:methionine sulfoxide reductase heme-binding subunit
MQWFNVWYLIRSTGYVSYILISLSVILGLYSQLQKSRGAKVNGLLTFAHMNMGNWGFYLGLMHGILTAFDTYQPFQIKELLIPFLSHYKNFAMGMGIISMYCLIITIFTSEFRSVIGIALWRKLHMFTPLVYLSATIHGIYIGSDSQQLWSFYLYLVSIALVAILLLLRFFTRTKANVSQVL